MADDITKTPPPLAVLSPRLQTRVQNATVFIQRRGGGLDPDKFPLGSDGSGFIVENSNGRIATSMHVVSGNIGAENYTGSQAQQAKDPVIEVYSYAFDPNKPTFIGNARIVAYGRQPGDPPSKFYSHDQAVLEIYSFAPGMKEKFKLLPGLSIAPNQSANLLAFVLPDRTAINHSNSGGPAVNDQAQVVGMNAGLVEKQGYDFTGVSYIASMSNSVINKALLGAASKKIAVHGPDGKPIRIVTYGFRSGVSDQLNATAYQAPYEISALGPYYQPPATSPFAAAAMEVVRDKNRSLEPLPTFLRDMYKDGQLYDGSHNSFFRLGHSKDGKSFVDFYRPGNPASEVILYFDDKNQKIPQWMQANHKQDPEGFFKRLLGNNKDDLARLYKTLNDVAQGKPDAPTATQNPTATQQRTNSQRVPPASRPPGAEPHFSNTQLLKGHDPKVNTHPPRPSPRDPGRSI